jgi:hypothetical protein
MPVTKREKVPVTETEGKMIGVEENGKQKTGEKESKKKQDENEKDENIKESLLICLKNIVTLPKEYTY